jgi:hypothetical protein
MHPTLHRRLDGHRIRGGVGAGVAVFVIPGGMPNAELTGLAAPPGPAFALVHRLDSTHRNGVALLDQG